MEEKVIYHVGVYGLSWPTDTILDNETSMGKVKDTTVYVNLQTLVRNALNSFDDKDNLKNALKTIKDRIDSDISLMKDFFSSNNNTEVIVYHAMYNNLHHNAFVKLVKPKTDKNAERKKITDEAVELVKELADLTITKGILSNPNQGTGKTEYLITHLPLDLLQVNTFTKLNLLESFTGDIRTFKEFNSKLNFKKELREYIPLTATTLRVFGDSHMFAPLDKKVKDIVIATAKKFGWTPLTTDSRVLFCIKREDKPLYDILKNIGRL
ncbi:hypothetical protein TSMG0141 [Halocynthia phage JM-2012]|uniref:hypothetical protein n=1 Tax=Halocynthia phage JM-2012 TaxID=1173297 RepID=UPI00025C6969|nr:hypothetical protein TSMG0141 [Halocynthia phage JM-2012]AFI55424.1 hypothetical protein TSMG0141 [Halocynthia phage JM-2012]